MSTKYTTNGSLLAFAGSSWVHRAIYARRHAFKGGKEYLAAHAGAPYMLGNCSETLGWKDPLSAILTHYPNGRIKIEGSQSEWLFGVTPQMAGFPEYDAADRLIRPVIQSCDFSLNFA